MSGLELCQKCNGLHYKNAPCIVRGTKSTAARKDVQLKGVSSRPKTSQSGEGRSGCAPSPADAGSLSPNQAEIAGTQALPVDTIPKPNLGRPRIHPDRKAYRAAWMRKDRARKKASAEGRE